MRAAFPSAQLVNVIHDEIPVECDADRADAVARWLKNHMEAAAQQLLPDIPVVADPTIMVDWSGTPRISEDGETA
jgi:DNA polymerase I-like protein with 3'-5' exonuclease and polymerase domains